MKRLLYFLFLLVPFCRAQAVYIYHDKFTDQKHVWIDMGNQTTFRDKFFGHTYIDMELDAFPGKSFSGLLVVRYSSSDWLNIDKGETLIFKVGDRFIKFAGDGSFKDRSLTTAPVGVKEKATYELTAEQLRALDSATGPIPFRLIGQSSAFTGEVSKKGVEAIKQFARVVPMAGFTINGIHLVADPTPAVAQAATK